MKNCRGPYFDSRHFVSQIKNQSLLLLGSRSDMSNERFFPSYHQIKARKAVECIGKSAAVKQIRREMRQIQQLLQEVKMKIATYNVRVDTSMTKIGNGFRKEAVCQLINFHDWSLCCIQVRPNQVRDLKAYTTFTCLSAEREGMVKEKGLAILYNEQKLRLLIQGILVI